jgi:hypothetical protein
MAVSRPEAFMGVFVPPKPDKKGRKPKDPNAPKRPRGRPRKDASQPTAKQGADTSTSDSESDELQIEEMPEPTPDLLRDPPPEIPEHRVIYDIATAVWYPRNRLAVAEKVRAGIALFGDVVKKQRDAWKVKNEALKQAELANTAAIPSLKQEVSQFRKTIETMAVQALRFGHPAHLAKYVYTPPSFPLLLIFLSMETGITRSHLESHLCRDEQNGSILLQHLQSHNKGLDNGYRTKAVCRELHDHVQMAVPPYLKWAQGTINITPNVLI